MKAFRSCMRAPLELGEASLLRASGKLMFAIRLKAFWGLLSTFWGCTIFVVVGPHHVATE